MAFKTWHVSRSWHWFFLVLALLSGFITLLSNILPVARSPIFLAGEYDEQLVGIDTLDKAEALVRRRLPPHPTQAQTADTIERFLRQRFVHDTGMIKFTSNWVAWLGSKLIWQPLGYATLPDDMLKNRRLICSQQAMLFQALLKRFGIEYATVGFAAPAHMLVGAKIGGRWAVYDSDEEPRRDRTVYYSELGNPATVYALYRGKKGPSSLGYGGDLGRQRAAAAARGEYEIKWINQNPAPHATIFHQATLLASRFGWLLLSLAAFLSWPGRRAGGEPWPDVRGRRAASAGAV